MSFSEIDVQKLTLRDPADFKNSLVPKKVTLKRKDGTEIREVQVTIWKRSSNRIIGSLFDMTTRLASGLMTRSCYRSVQSDGSIVWINKESLKRALLQGFTKMIEQIAEPSTKAKVQQIYQQHQKRIETFIYSEESKLSLPIETGIGKVTIKRTAQAIHIKEKKEIGKGGFKTVYKVHDLINNKIYAKAITIKSTARVVTELEYKTCKKISQAVPQGMVQLHKIKTATNITSIWMEYLGGGSLTNLFKDLSTDKADKSPSKKISLLKKLCDAGETVSKIHESGYIHGDLKPDNIMLTDNGETRIIDFGFAQKVNQTLKGSTPNYRPPEANTVGKKETNPIKATAQFDSWSMGIMFLTALAGKESIKQVLGKSPPEMTAEELQAKLKALPWDTYTPKTIVERVKQLLEVEPEKRATLKTAIPLIKRALEDIQTNE